MIVSLQRSAKTLLSPLFGSAEVLLSQKEQKQGFCIPVFRGILKPHQFVKSPPTLLFPRGRRGGFAGLGSAC